MVSGRSHGGDRHEQRAKRCGPDQRVPHLHGPKHVLGGNLSFGGEPFR